MGLFPDLALLIIRTKLLKSFPARMSGRLSIKREKLLSPEKTREKLSIWTLLFLEQREYVFTFLGDCGEVLGLRNLRKVLQVLARPEFYPFPLLNFDLLFSPDVSSETGLFFDNFQTGKSSDLYFVPIS